VRPDSCCDVGCVVGEVQREVEVGGELRQGRFAFVGEEGADSGGVEGITVESC
jgi:hypothetical protein